MAVLARVYRTVLLLSRHVWLVFPPRMESLEMALQIVLPLEKECARLCDPHLPFCTVALQGLHPVELDGIYQNLRVSKFSQCIYEIFSSSD